MTSKDMLSRRQIADAAVADWRKLGQGLTPDIALTTSLPPRGSRPRSARSATTPGTTRECRSGRAMST